MARMQCKKDNDDIDYEKIRIQVTEYQTNEDSKSGWYVIKETPEIYRAFTLPYIMDKRNDLQYAWIQQLANGKKQNEIHNQLVYDKQFNFRAYLSPDWVSKKHHCSTTISKSQWGKHPDTDIKYYHVTAFVSARQYKDELMTLRDIRGKHSALLHQIKKRVLQRSNTIYGIKESDVTMIVNYKPRTYLLAIHFVHIEHPTWRTQHFRDHSLNDILRNIKEDPNYYRDATFDIMVFFNHGIESKSERFDQHIRPHLQGKYRMYMTKEGAWRAPDDGRKSMKVMKGKPYNINNRWNTGYIQEACVEQKDWRQNVPKAAPKQPIRPLLNTTDTNGLWRGSNKRVSSLSSRTDNDRNWRKNSGARRVLSLSGRSKGFRRTAKACNDGNSSWRSSIRPVTKQIEK